MASTSIYDIEVTDIQGQSGAFSRFKDKVVLVVNVASECGFTKQYAGLQTLHETYHARGLEVLGFPCNQFGGQEPGDEAQIAEFCSAKFDVSFPLFAKVEVNGPGAHPLFAHLKSEAPGLLGSEAIKWNFTKFLLGRDGKVWKRYAPSTDPQDLVRDIEALL